MAYSILRELKERLSDLLNGLPIAMHFLTKELSLQENDIVLDLGGGVGKWSKHFSRFCDQVILVDLEAEGYEGSLYCAKRTLKSNIHIIKVDIQALPIKSYPIETMQPLSNCRP